MLGDLIVFGIQRVYDCMQIAGLEKSDVAHIKEKKNTRTGWIIVKYSTHLWVERGIYCIFVK